MSLTMADRDGFIWCDGELRPCRLGFAARLTLGRGSLVVVFRVGASSMPFRTGRGNFGAQTRERFLRLLLPVRAAESLRRNRVPFHCFGLHESFFLKQPKLPRDHRVAGALIKFGKFCVRVGGVFRLANARLDLPPVCHGEAL